MDSSPEDDTADAVETANLDPAVATDTPAAVDSSPEVDTADAVDTAAALNPVVDVDTAGAAYIRTGPCPTSRPTARRASPATGGGRRGHLT